MRLDKIESVDYMLVKGRPVKSEGVADLKGGWLINDRAKLKGGRAIEGVIGVFNRVMHYNTHMILDILLMLYTRAEMHMSVMLSLQRDQVKMYAMMMTTPMINAEVHAATAALIHKIVVGPGTVRGRELP